MLIYPSFVCSGKTTACHDQCRADQPFAFCSELHVMDLICIKNYSNKSFECDCEHSIFWFSLCFSFAL